MHDLDYNSFNLDIFSTAKSKILKLHDETTCFQQEPHLHSVTPMVRDRVISLVKSHEEDLMEKPKIDSDFSRNLIVEI